MGRSLPSLTSLRAFEAAARHQSFTRAAEELNVTHVAISRQVRALEEWLGVALFERLNRRVRLTETGRLYLPTLSGAFDDIAVATSRLRRRPPTTEVRRLALGVDPGLASRWLMGHLRELRSHAPDIEVEVQPALTLPDFRDENVDAAIHYDYGASEWQRVVDGVPLRATRLFDCRAFPVCRPDLASTARPLATPADLRRHRLLHEQDTVWWQRWLQAAGADHAVDWQRGPVYHDSNLTLDACLAGEGVAVGDNLLAYADLEAGRLVKPFRLAIPTGSYYLVTRNEATLPARLLAFRDWLCAAAAQQQRDSARW